MVSDKLSKPEPAQAMEAAADGHFSGLHFDEYPVTKHLGANKVPFVIGTFPICFTVEKLV